MRARVSVTTLRRLDKLGGNGRAPQAVLLLPPIERDHPAWEVRALASQSELARLTREGVDEARDAQPDPMARGVRA